MMNEDFNKPFLKSLVIVTIVTIFAMVSSKYIVNYYFHNSKNIKYSSQESYMEQIPQDNE